MKLIIEPILQDMCWYNKGRQYFDMNRIPFKVGDEVFLTSAAKTSSLNRLVTPEHLYIEEIVFKGDVPNPERSNIIIKLNFLNSTCCCSWVYKLDIWKRLI